MAHPPADALATLGPLLAANNPDAGTLELASSACEQAKATSQAVTTLRQAILLEPQNVDLYLDFANLSYTHGSFQVGIDVINDRLGLQPKAAPLYFARGVLYVQLADYDQAEADFAKAYELDPYQSLSAAARGSRRRSRTISIVPWRNCRHLWRGNRTMPFCSICKQTFWPGKTLIPARPTFNWQCVPPRKPSRCSPGWARRGECWRNSTLESGRYPEAIEQCRRALNRDPTDQSVVYHQIQALRTSGDKDEIPELLKRLAELREQALRKDKERYQYKLVD